MAEGDTAPTPIAVREYGSEGPVVLVLHGGPGAPGYLAPVAERLSHRFRVLEPLQRGSGSEPLTVTGHVADLQDVVRSTCPVELHGPPHVVGHSWGAMLALAHAATHPDSVRSLALVGCGTFDVESRERLIKTRAERMTEAIRERLESLTRTVGDANLLLRKMAEASLPIDAYEIDDTDAVFCDCDARAHDETWSDMLREQAAGTYPGGFRAIEAPVIMLHGEHDPHPGSLIRDSLQRFMPQLEYHEWKKCGHYPWLERTVGSGFFDLLTSWLLSH